MAPAPASAAVVPVSATQAALRQFSVNRLQPAVLCGTLLPLPVLVLRWRLGLLHADAIAEILNQFGYLALVLLLSSLACTPLKLLFGWAWPLRLRKTLGLMGFFYAALHFLTYILVDKSADLQKIWEDITQRNFILAGFAAFVLLIPLAVTSTNAMIRRLGAKRWRALHRLAYVISILGVVHFFLRVKAGISEPLIWGGILAVLLGIRIKHSLKRPSAPMAEAANDVRAK